MGWTLRRYRLGETVTDGRLILTDYEKHICTLERPWLPGGRGGVAFKSCIPDGEYQLKRHTRPNGDLVLALRNPDLGVYYQQGEVPDEGGRYLILLHSANWVKDVVGCIAPGMTRTIDDDGNAMVTSSRAAMALVMRAFDEVNKPGGAIKDGMLKVVTESGAFN